MQVIKPKRQTTLHQAPYELGACVPQRHQTTVIEVDPINESDGTADKGKEAQEAVDKPKNPLKRRMTLEEWAESKCDECKKPHIRSAMTKIKNDKDIRIMTRGFIQKTLVKHAKMKKNNADAVELRSKEKDFVRNQIKESRKV